jgi:hypothetical protein
MGASLHGQNAGRLRLDGLASLREVIPDVRFANRIKVVTRDGRAAAAWSHQSQAIPRP